MTTDSLPWFWDIQRQGSGPHYFLILDFDADEIALRRAIAPWLTDYQPFDGMEGSLIHQDSGAWAYTSLSIQGGQLAITRGWGHNLPQDDAFLRPLLLSPALKLVQWQVRAGGDGYASQNFGQGSDVRSFLAYCRGCI